MRLSCLVLVAFACVSHADPLTEHVSVVYITQGSQSEINQRAANCITKHAKFGAIVRTSYSAVPVGQRSLPRRLQLEGGPSLLQVRENLVEGRARDVVSVNGDRRSIQSLISIETKENRFRIRDQGIGTLSLSRTNQATNYSPPDSETKLAAGVVQVLDRLTNRLSKCIQRESTDTW